MSTNDASEILAAWEISSQYWNKHQALIEEMYAPLSRALIEEAGIAAGQSVLDIGGGSGEPSLTIARVVGSTGSVTYTDPAAGMVRSAREEAKRRGLENIQFHQAPVEHLPFADASFDVAVSRLSAMFFPDVLAGLREFSWRGKTKSCRRVFAFKFCFHKSIEYFGNYAEERIDFPAGPNEE